jgi:hypothetical protein
MYCLKSALQPKFQLLSNQKLPTANVAPLPRALLALRVTHTPRSIQRLVGFEFELEEVLTAKKDFYGNFEPLKKKDKLLERRGLFSVEADVREDGTSDMEIVTEAFPENQAGIFRLHVAMTEISGLLDRLKQLNMVQRETAASSLAAFGTPKSNRWMYPRVGNNHLPFSAKPQATAGIRLRHLDRLLRDMEYDQLARAAAPSAKKVIGGWDSFNDPTNAGIPAITKARAAAGTVLARLARPRGRRAWSNKLRGLVALLALYIDAGRTGVRGYAKTIANPIMARTDFATIYRELPLDEQRYFAIEQNAGRQTWLFLVLDVAGLIAGKKVSASEAVFSGGLFNDPFMYNLALRPMNNPLRKLTRRDWLRGIAFDNKDRLSARHYPGTPAQTEELESLGSYGANVDLFGQSQSRAPIFEFRGLGSAFGGVPYTDWYSFALSFLRYMRAVNRGSAQDYDQTLDPARSADLAGLGGAAAQHAERRNQYVLGMTPPLAWPV